MMIAHTTETRITNDFMRRVEERKQDKMHEAKL
jgi:hypothetical protein